MKTSRLALGLGGLPLLALGLWAASRSGTATPSQRDAISDAPTANPSTGATPGGTSVDDEGEAARLKLMVRRAAARAEASGKSGEQAGNTRAAVDSAPVGGQGVGAVIPASAGGVAEARPFLVPLTPHEHDEPHDAPSEAAQQVANNPSGSPFGEMGCAKEQAFTAGALHFSEPTPPALAAVLEAGTKGGRAITLVLRKQDEAYRAALGATRPGASGKEAFLPEKTPTSALMVPAFGEPPGISSNVRIDRGYLLVGSGKAQVALELRGLVWRASKGSSCDEMNVDVRAILLPSQFATALPTADGSRTIADLLGVTLPPGGAVDPSPGGSLTDQITPESIHFAFRGTPSRFDFSAL